MGSRAKEVLSESSDLDVTLTRSPEFSLVCKCKTASSLTTLSATGRAMLLPSGCEGHCGCVAARTRLSSLGWSSTTLVMTWSSGWLAALLLRQASMCWLKTSRSVVCMVRKHTGQVRLWMEVGGGGGAKAGVGVGMGRTNAATDADVQGGESDTMRSLAHAEERPVAVDILEAAVVEDDDVTVTLTFTQASSHSAFVVVRLDWTVSVSKCPNPQSDATASWLLSSSLLSCLWLSANVTGTDSANPAAAAVPWFVCRWSLWALARWKKDC